MIIALNVNIRALKGRQANSEFVICDTYLYSILFCRKNILVLKFFKFIFYKGIKSISTKESDFDP